MNIVIHNFNFSIYGVCILASIIIGMIFIYISLRKKKIDKEKIMLSFMLMILLVITGGKLFTIVTSESNNLLTAGLSSYGGAIGMILTVVIFTFIYPDYKKDFIDNYILSIPLIYSISKLGCFFVGCCHGIEYNGIFNVTYIDASDISYFPVQLAETIAFMIIFIICLIIYSKTKYKKYIIEIVFILSGLCKFLLDYLRISHIGQTLSINQIVSIIFILIGVIMIIIKKIRSK